MPAAAHEFAFVRTKKHFVALTFDDGPSEWTSPVCEVLRNWGVQATFFVIGSAVADRAEALRTLHSDRHEIGNHTQNHIDLTGAGITTEEIRTELDRAGTAIESVLAVRPTLFRPPGFRSSPLVRMAAAHCGIRYVVQSQVWSQDYKLDSSSTIAAEILNHPDLRPGAIITLHDGRPPDEGPWPEGSRADRWRTVEALETIVPSLLEQGLTPVTVSELIRRNLLMRLGRMASTRSVRDRSSTSRS